ncbi:hypothetical protein [Streptomyces axinellae]
MPPHSIQVLPEAAFAEDTLGMLFQLGITALPSAAWPGTHQRIRGA